MEQLPKNNYEILILPIGYNKRFLDLSLEELHEYYQWFLSIKDDRLSRLCSYLFQKQDGCLIEKNLRVLEIFLLNSISTVPKPKEQYDTEMEKVPMHLKPFAKPDDYLFDKKTISICYDVGIFMGELIIKLDNKIKWKLETDDEYSDYGQPVLSKKNNMLKLNPFTVTKNTAAKIFEGRYTEGEIISFFKAWKKGFNIDE